MNAKGDGIFNVNICKGTVTIEGEMQNLQIITLTMKETYSNDTVQDIFE